MVQDLKSNPNPLPLIQLRALPTRAEQVIAQERQQSGWPHIRPNSVLVYAMGHHWSPGSWEAVIDMVMHTSASGVYCAFQEGQDRCFNPYDALGTMRNEAILMAQNEGFDWLCYVDNDILPQKDFLLRLLSWNMRAIAPYVV